MMIIMIVTSSFYLYARKDTEFIATLQSSKLDYQIRVITDIIRTEIGELENDVEDKSMLKEEVLIATRIFLLEVNFLAMNTFCFSVKFFY